MKSLLHMAEIKKTKPQLIVAIGFGNKDEITPWSHNDTNCGFIHLKLTNTVDNYEKLFIKIYTCVCGCVFK